MTNHKMGPELPGKQLGGNTTDSEGEHWVPPSALAGSPLASLDSMAKSNGLIPPNT